MNDLYRVVKEIIHDIANQDAEEVDRDKLMALAEGILREVKDPDLHPPKEMFEAEVKATEQGLNGNPPAWVADESKWEEAKKVSTETYGEIRYPFVSWLYTHQLEGAQR